MIAGTPANTFENLLERHRKIVFKVANSYAWNPDDRDELAQDIALQLWRAFPGYDPQRRFSTWMYRIALNVAISYVRSHSHRDGHHVPLDESLHDVADERGADCADDERVRTLQGVIAQLDVLNRALLLLYLDEHSYREIGDVLGLSETNVATKLSRLKQRIRNGLA
jgi:RNA polymerase sigma-70 factor (ECF subfamily)